MGPIGISMTTTTIQRIIKRDCNGYNYSVPEDQCNEFDRLNEAIENAEFMSDEQQSAADEFLNQFDVYLK
jgi:hypothetical protein